MTPNGLFRVVWTGLLLERIEAWGTQARETGTFQEFAATWRTIQTRLKRNPREWGEFLRHYEHLDLEEYLGALAPFVVRYTVHHSELLVFVVDVTRLSP
jgi:hypothetical protein